MEFYVVCERYTGALEGVYGSLQQAQLQAKNIGGFVQGYQIDQNQQVVEIDLDDDGFED